MFFFHKCARLGAQAGIPLASKQGKGRALNAPIISTFHVSGMASAPGRMTTRGRFSQREAALCRVGR